MPLDLTNEETKKEVDALLEAKTAEKLKEMGVDDHAKKVIERLNGESKSQREAREAAEKKVTDLETKSKDLEKKLAELSDSDARKKKELEAEQKRIEDEKKTAEQRLADRMAEMEKTFNDALSKREKDQKAELKRLSDELSARDSALLSEAVRSAAVKRGIIDEDLIKLFDLSEIKVENGRVDREAVEKVLDVLVETKPTYFKAPDEQRRDEGGRFVRPDPKSKSDGADASKLNDDQFAALEAGLRRSKA